MLLFLFIVVLAIYQLFDFYTIDEIQPTTTMIQPQNNSPNNCELFADIDKTFEDSPQVRANLTKQIADKLNISQRRILNLTYEAKLTNGLLNATFIIDEPNFIETYNGEPTKENAQKQLDSFILLKQFTINVTGIPALLNYYYVDSTATNLNSKEAVYYYKNPRYFNNTGLLDLIDYTHKVYNVVPTDISLTKFYTLDFDADFKPIAKAPPSS